MKEGNGGSIKFVDEADKVVARTKMGFPVSSSQLEGFQKFERETQALEGDRLSRHKLSVNNKDEKDKEKDALSYGFASFSVKRVSYLHSRIKAKEARSIPGGDDDDDTSDEELAAKRASRVRKRVASIRCLNCGGDVPFSETKDHSYVCTHSQGQEKKAQEGEGNIELGEVEIVVCEEDSPRPGGEEQQEEFELKQFSKKQKKEGGSEDLEEEGWVLCGGEGDEEKRDEGVPEVDGEYEPTEANESDEIEKSFAAIITSTNTTTTNTTTTTSAPSSDAPTSVALIEEEESVDEIVTLSEKMALDVLLSAMDENTFSLEQLRSLNMIPQRHRLHYWSLASHSYLRMSVCPSYYRELRELLDMHESLYHSQILADVPRTFPDHPILASRLGQLCLTRLLAAYALHNPRIGYAQSLNFIAGIILFVVIYDRHTIRTRDPKTNLWRPRTSKQEPHFSPPPALPSIRPSIERHKAVFEECEYLGDDLIDHWDSSLNDDDLCEIEEISFWLFVFLMDVIPEHHISSLLGARAAQGVLEELVMEHLPDVWNHLKEMDVPLAMISMQWFFSLYLTDFAPETALQVLDFMFINQNDRSVYLTALSILQLRREEILACNSGVEILEIKNTPHFLLMPIEMLAAAEKLSLKVTLEEISRLRRECRLKVVDEVVEFCKRKAMRAIQVKKVTTLTVEKLDYICAVVKQLTGTAVTDFDFYTFSCVLDGIVPHFSSAPFVCIRKLFRLHDEDNDGFLTFEEMLVLMAILFEEGPEKKAALLFSLLDRKTNGSVSRHHLYFYLYPEEKRANEMTKVGDLEDLVYFNEFQSLVSHSKMMGCFELNSKFSKKKKKSIRSLFLGSEKPAPPPSSKLLIDPSGSPSKKGTSTTQGSQFPLRFNLPFGKDSEKEKEAPSEGGKKRPFFQLPERNSPPLDSVEGGEFPHEVSLWRPFGRATGNWIPCSLWERDNLLLISSRPTGLGRVFGIQNTELQYGDVIELSRWTKSNPKDSLLPDSDDMSIMRITASPQKGLVTHLFFGFKEGEWRDECLRTLLKNVASANAQMGAEKVMSLSDMEDLGFLSSPGLDKPAHAPEEMKISGTVYDVYQWNGTEWESCFAEFVKGCMILFTVDEKGEKMVLSQIDRVDMQRLYALHLDQRRIEEGEEENSDKEKESDECGGSTIEADTRSITSMTRKRLDFDGGEGRSHVEERRSVDTFRVRDKSDETLADDKKASTKEGEEQEEDSKILQIVKGLRNVRLAERKNSSPSTPPNEPEAAGISLPPEPPSPTKSNPPPSSPPPSPSPVPSSPPEPAEKDRSFLFSRNTSTPAFSRKPSKPSVKLPPKETPDRPFFIIEAVRKFEEKAEVPEAESSGSEKRRASLPDSGPREDKDPEESGPTVPSDLPDQKSKQSPTTSEPKESPDQSPIRPDTPSSPVRPGSPLSPVRHPLSPLSPSTPLRPRPSAKRVMKRRKLENCGWESLFSFLSEDERDCTGKLVGCSALSSLRQSKTGLYPVIFPVTPLSAHTPPSEDDPPSSSPPIEPPPPPRFHPPRASGEASQPSHFPPSPFSTPPSSPTQRSLSTPPARPSASPPPPSAVEVPDDQSDKEAAPFSSPSPRRRSQSPPANQKKQRDTNPHNSLFSAFSLRPAPPCPPPSPPPPAPPSPPDDFFAIAFSNKEERDRWLMEADQGVPLGYIPRFKVVSVHVVNVKKEDIFSLSLGDVCSMFASDVSRVLQIPFSEGEFPEVVKLFSNVPLLFGRPPKLLTSKASRSLSKGAGGSQPTAKVDVEFRSREGKRWLKWGNHIEMLCWITEDPIADRHEYSSWGKIKGNAPVIPLFGQPEKGESEADDKKRKLSDLDKRALMFSNNIDSMTLDEHIVIDFTEEM